VPISAPEVSPEEERQLSVIEDAAQKGLALRFRYYTASRGAEGQRYASVHRVFPGPPARFVATCHRAHKLKWFRVDNVNVAALDQHERFHVAKDDAIDAFIAESLDGFHEGGPAQEVAFFVREPEARWVARNLMSGMKSDDQEGGIRVTVKISSVGRVARYVVSLGDAVSCETPILADAVVAIARGALAHSRG
jgi:predicted DNA-binding transcriptional regulator YafY